LENSLDKESTIQMVFIEDFYIPLFNIVNDPRNQFLMDTTKNETKKTQVYFATTIHSKSSSTHQFNFPGPSGNNRKKKEIELEKSDENKVNKKQADLIIVKKGTKPTFDKSLMIDSLIQEFKIKEEIKSNEKEKKESKEEEGSTKEKIGLKEDTNLSDQLREAYIDVARNCLFAYDTVDFTKDITQRSIVTVRTRAQLVRITDIRAVRTDQYKNIMNDDLSKGLQLMSINDKQYTPVKSGFRIVISLEFWEIGDLLIKTNLDAFAKYVLSTLVLKMKAEGEIKEKTFDDDQGPFFQIHSSENKIVEFEYIYPLVVNPKNSVFKIRVRYEKEYSVLKIGDVLEEIKTLNKLKDIKNVQHIIFTGKSRNGKDCFVSPFYGETLSKYCGDISQSSQIWKQIKKLLSQIHERGIVHSDIKPKNICVSHNGIVTLIDFDVARVSGEGISPLGTIKYCSASQMLGIFPPQKRNDFESLEYTKYYILNGPLPWSNDEFPIVLKKKQEFLQKYYQNGTLNERSNEKNKENFSTKINHREILI